jgi:YaiO family outer membrane protein
MRWILTITTIVLAFAVPAQVFAEIGCATEARYLRMQKRFNEAEQTARKCIEDQPENADAYVELARSLAARERHQEALDWANKALTKYSDSADLKLLKARLLAWTDRAEEAQELLGELPQQVYDRPDAMRLRGDVLLWGEQYTQAVKWYNRYDQKDPDNPIVLYKRAMAYKGMGRNSQALADLRKSCEIAPEATNACKARDSFAESAYPKLYTNVFYGYSRVVNRLDGWRLRGAVGSELNENLTLMGTWEWMHRPFFDEREADWRFNGYGYYEFDMGLNFKGGGGFSPSPVFSPEWNAFVEPGWKFEHFKVSARFWHIQFPSEPNEVLNPNVELYFKPFMLEARYFLTFSEDDLSHSAFLRGFYFITNLTQVYVGGGLGDKSDYLEPRDLNADSHWLVTAGFRYMLTPNHRFMISVTQRNDQDSSEWETYDQTETLVGYEFRL